MRKTAIALALTLAAANPANAQVMWLAEPVATGPGTRFFDGPPPARFIKEGFYNLLLVSPERLNQACGVENPTGLKLMGCTRTTKTGVRVVIMPLSANPYNWFVLIHETGHVNGWSGNHEL